MATDMSRTDDHMSRGREIAVSLEAANANLRRATLEVAVACTREESFATTEGSREGPDASESEFEERRQRLRQLRENAVDKQNRASDAVARLESELRIVVSALEEILRSLGSDQSVVAHSRVGSQEAARELDHAERAIVDDIRRIESFIARMHTVLERTARERRKAQEIRPSIGEDTDIRETLRQAELCARKPERESARYDQLRRRARILWDRMRSQRDRLRARADYLRGEGDGSQSAWIASTLDRLDMAFARLGDAYELATDDANSYPIRQARYATRTTAVAMPVTTRQPAFPQRDTPAPFRQDSMTPWTAPPPAPSHPVSYIVSSQPAQASPTPRDLAQALGGHLSTHAWAQLDDAFERAGLRSVRYDADRPLAETTLGSLEGALPLHSGGSFVDSARRIARSRTIFGSGAVSLAPGRSVGAIAPPPMLTSAGPVQPSSPYSSAFGAPFAQGFPPAIGLGATAGGSPPVGPLGGSFGGPIGGFGGGPVGGGF